MMWESLDGTGAVGMARVDESAGGKQSSCGAPGVAGASNGTNGDEVMRSEVIYPRHREAQVRSDGSSSDARGHAHAHGIPFGGVPV